MVTYNYDMYNFNLARQILFLGIKILLYSDICDRACENSANTEFGFLYKINHHMILF